MVIIIITIMTPFVVPRLLPRGVPELPSELPTKTLACADAAVSARGSKSLGFRGYARDVCLEAWLSGRAREDNSEQVDRLS